jgi:hypothetical protein
MHNRFINELQKDDMADAEKVMKSAMKSLHK